MPAEVVGLVGSHDGRLVALSILIAVLASGAALDFAGRVTATPGPTRRWWLAGGALIMGLGIWSMHYTGMLAYRLPIPTRYHLPTVGLSLASAVLAASVALLVAGRPHLTAAGVGGGSVIMGGGIAAMHYIGMAAMRLPAATRWNIWLVAASVLIAILVSGVALWLAFRFGQSASGEWTWRKAGGALVMGAAIPSMHYTGMAAATFVPSPDRVMSGAGTVEISTLGAGAIAAATLLILLAAIGSSIIDRRLSAQAHRLRIALAEVKTLQGLLPICANCRRVRSDQGSWQEIEAYVRQRTDAVFSHGICPECAVRWDQAT